MSNILKGKVALVTGGSRGLGAATAEALADQGAHVAISYVASAEKAEAVVRKLKAKGVRALAIQSDQADTVAARPLVDKVVAHFGKLDILVNNAAIAVQGKTVDDPELDTLNLDVKDSLPDAVMDQHPIRRIATLEEVSALVCYLAGPHGAYMTGSVIDVAGGLSI